MSTRAPLLTLDTLDDRREVYMLLDRVSPARRLAWLAWCCGQVAARGGVLRPKVAARSRGDVLDVYFDFWALVAQYGLDPESAANELVRRVRRWVQ